MLASVHVLRGDDVYAGAADVFDDHVPDMDGGPHGGLADHLQRVDDQGLADGGLGLDGQGHMLPLHPHQGRDHAGGIGDLRLRIGLAPGAGVALDVGDFPAVVVRRDAAAHGAVDAGDQFSLLQGRIPPKQ